MSFDASEREQQARDFLQRSGLSGAQRTPMSGDASTRRYERLATSSGGSLIFMDAPPAAESEPAGPETTPNERRALGYNAMARLAACRVDAFAGASVFLRGLGLSAPAVDAMDVPWG